MILTTDICQVSRKLFFGVSRSGFREREDKSRERRSAKQKSRERGVDRFARKNQYPFSNPGPRCTGQKTEPNFRSSYL